MKPHPQSYRAIVVLDGLDDGQLPAALTRLEVHRYRHHVHSTTEWTIAELAVEQRDVAAVAFELSAALVPTKYYAHLVSPTTMYVAFPDCVAVIRRCDKRSVARAQAIGQSFGIPLEQMQFADMFDDDHPDAPT